MEQLPADARAAPSASEPNDTVMDIHASPKRPRESAQGNMVSQSATSTASVLPESQAPATACQSLAHHTTPMGRCRKSVDTWAPLSEESQSRSTTTTPAERLGNLGNSAIRHTGSCPSMQSPADDRRLPRAHQPASQTQPARKSRLHPPSLQYNFQAQKQPHHSPRMTLRGRAKDHRQHTERTHTYFGLRYPQTNTQTHLSPHPFSSEGQRQGPTTSSSH
eukprot:scaffold5762_cov101-Isochrysis_galbana.AAC.3